MDEEFQRITDVLEILQMFSPVMQLASDLGWDVVSVGGNGGDLVAIAVVMPPEVTPFMKRLRKRYRVVAVEMAEEDEADLNP